MNIVITGGGKGIGKSIAAKFLEENNNIFIIGRNEETLKETSAELNKKHKRNAVEYFAGDASKKEIVDIFCNWIKDKNVVPDVVINNAGQFVPGSIYNEEDGTLEKMLAANLYSAYYVSRGLLPSMISKRSGHIFNMCSIASLKAYANGGSYSISKYALMGLSKNLREEMKQFNIKVTTVYPGAVYTSSWSESGIPESRIMEAGDIAEMIYAAAKLSLQACVEDIVIRPQLGDLP